MVSYHPAKFGGQRHFDRKCMVVFVFHVTLQDHVTNGSRDFIGGVPNGKPPFCQVWWPEALCIVAVGT